MGVEAEERRGPRALRPLAHAAYGLVWAGLAGVFFGASDLGNLAKIFGDAGIKFPLEQWHQNTPHAVAGVPRVQV